MYRTEATEAYNKALKEAAKEYKECAAKELDPNPLVLDDLLGADGAETCVPVGIVEIPVERIVGTKSAGRISAFTPSFRPLLKPDTEFAAKWISLCADHLGEVGIREPIVCCEYLGNFYVQEGNKRVSVLRHFGAPRITANVSRILPVREGPARLKAYQEFLEFYKQTGLYELQFTAPGGYAKLCSALGYAQDQPWTEEERRRFRAHLFYFTEALKAAGDGQTPMPVEEALLTWLEVHPFSDLKELSAAELKKSVQQLLPNMLAAATPEPVVKTEPPEERSKIVQILKGVDHLNVAFIHQYSGSTSHWTQDHETGRKYMELALGDAVTTRVYQSANTPEQAARLIDQAVEEGAEVVFTTAPQLIGPSMKGSVKYPKVRFLNCSVHQPYASVRTYYSRIHEGKFISGAIAGAMCKGDRVGYVGSYPTMGVTASINAFALGVQMTNPRARVELKWSCVPGNPTRELLAEGVRVISNRDMALEDQVQVEHGLFLADEDGQFKSLASPCWVWGQFYENVVRSIMKGGWEDEKGGKIVNLWWGMRSGVIDVTLSEALPEGVRLLAGILKKGICEGTLDPFARRIVDQRGIVRNDGSAEFSPVELLKMDWLCENVDGSLPEYEELLPSGRIMVDLLGIRTKDTEVPENENTGSGR